MKTQTQINEMVLGEMKKWNDEFVYEAIKEWDRGDEGCFAEFVQDYMTNRWKQMVMSN